MIPNRIRFKNARGGRKVNGPEYGSLYRQAGLSRRHQEGHEEFVLPMTDWRPLMDARAADVELRRMREYIRKLPRGALLAIEAIDCVQVADDAFALAQMARGRGVGLAVQLTYNHQNQLATGCRVRVGDVATGDGWHYDNERGLSALGREVARTLMDEGVLLDVSHLNRASALEVCEIGLKCRRPVVASHSNTLAGYAGRSTHPSRPDDSCAQRCLDDKTIEAVLATGGYVGLTTCIWFLNQGMTEWARGERAPEPSKEREVWQKEVLKVLVGHIQYVRELAGLKARESVALASDFDVYNGREDIPRGFTHRKYRGFFAELARALQENHGWSDADLRALMNGNVLHVLG